MGDCDEPAMETCSRKLITEKKLKIADLFVCYKGVRTKGDHRSRGALSAGDVEAVLICTITDLYRVKKKPRLSSPDVSTSCQFLTGFSRPTWASCEQVCPLLKQGIFSWVKNGIDVRPFDFKASQVQNKRYECCKAAKGKLPLSWFTKQPQLYAEIFDAFDIKQVVDLNAGSGGRLKSAFVLKEKKCDTFTS